MQQILSPLIEWATKHIPLIGWPSLVFLAWRGSRFLTKIEDRAITAEGHITKMATNCFPTMQSSLQNQDSILKSVDNSLKTLVSVSKPSSRSRTRSRRKK